MLPPAQENHAIHVAQDCLRIVLVNGLALGLGLLEQGQADLAGADHRHQLFQVRDLAQCWRPRPTVPGRGGAGGPMLIVRPPAQEVEHLGERQSRNEIIGDVRVADDEESRCPLVPQAVQLHFVVGHDLPELGDVRGGQLRAAANKYAPRCLAAG